MPHVLIIDDEEDLLDMVCLALPRSGFSTTCVLNTSDFFTELSRQRPDAILIDVYLGDEDGREICKKIKDDQQFTSTPVVLYSAGNISEESIVLSKADDFISKPFKLQDLADTLLQLCQS